MGESFSEAMRPVVDMLHFIGKNLLANALIDLGVILTILGKNDYENITEWREALEKEFEEKGGEK
jgi:hypothetical protein